MTLNTAFLLMAQYSGKAWLQTFDPTCRIIAPEARTLETISKLCRGH